MRNHDVKAARQMVFSLLFAIGGAMVGYGLKPACTEDPTFTLEEIKAVVEEARPRVIVAMASPDLDSIYEHTGPYQFAPVLNADQIVIDQPAVRALIGCADTVIRVLPSNHLKIK